MAPIRTTTRNPAKDVDRMGSGLARRLAPLYVDIAADIASGKSANIAIIRNKMVDARILTALLGMANARQRLVRQGLVEPVEVRPAARFALSDVVRMPFLAAVNRFEQYIPNLTSVVELLRRASVLRVDRLLESEVDAIRTVVDKIVGEASIKLGGVTIEPEQAATAVRKAMGIDRAAARLDTQARTVLMDGFNGGGREMVRQHEDVAPVMVLDELRDKRTRGNPNGLYPDGGVHYQMDGFAAATSDPVWDRITPPNGWNCRGTVRAISRDAAKRAGYLLDDGAVDVAGLRRLHASKWRLIESGRYPDEGFK